ncbi:MAG TPA: energy transducer TonB [Gammaproteobacteria bacterium]|nr:energy transducer TonB [Gammaproteobacteria bacterium]
MTARTSSTSITATDRLGLTLFLAVALHMIFILGLSFDLELLVFPEESPLPTMEITLVHSRSEEAPEDADYLAQANQRGGGNTPEKVRPSSQNFNPLPIPKQGDAPSTQQAASPQAQQDPLPTMQMMTVEQSDRAIPELDEKMETPSRPEQITSAKLIESSKEVASLDAEIRQLKETLAKLPREKHLNANTREYKYAAYMDAWRSKVERIGNLNYPDEAKSRQLYGRLLLDVVINADGSVKRIDLLRSSGHKILDDAAIRIVTLAAPFAPFPEHIRKDFDVLHITRTWVFENNNQLQTR